MPNLWVAIPDSSLSDEQTKRDKSIKIAQFARACSNFRVNTIYIYHDLLSKFDRNDPELIKTILRYLDTPQYLRRILYPRMDQLEYAGILHPIKAPHHKPRQDVRLIKAGEVRTGVITKMKDQLLVEVGLGSPVPFAGQGFDGKKVNVKFTSPYPDLKAVEAKQEDIFGYWGYDVKQASSLGKLLASSENAEVVITSRKGKCIWKVQRRLCERARKVRNILVVFGAPKHGVQEILSKEGVTIKPYEFVINMFPDQGTETIRLEEAVLGTLAILNSFLPPNYDSPRFK